MTASVPFYSNDSVIEAVLAFYEPNFIARNMTFFPTNEMETFSKCSRNAKHFEPYDVSAK